MLAMIIVLLMYYLFTLNTSATRWYNIRDLERQRQELTIEKERLDTKIAELDSSDSIESEKSLINIEDARNPEYLVIKSDVQYVYNY